MKKINIKCQWYIAVIIVCVGFYSFLCWIKFVKNFKSGEIAADVKTEQNHDLLTYTGDLDNYVDNMDFLWRGAMFKQSFFSRIDSICTYCTTKEISSSQVIVGKENWLFLKSSTDGDSISDFEGTNRYTSEEIYSIFNSALRTQEKFKEKGIQFAIMAAPNKENIYSEFMPEIYTHAEISSTDILIDFLGNNGVNIISPKKELLDGHTDFQLYYPYDTHWNQLGAYVGVRSVLDSWNIDTPALDDRDILSGKMEENYHYCAKNDLAQMIGLRNILYNDGIEYWIEGTGFIDWNQFEKEQENGEISYFSNQEAQVQASVLLVGDSFRTAMIPALQETFSDVYVIHRSYYTTEFLDEIQPKYLIVEYVERHSKQMRNIDTFVDE